MSKQFEGGAPPQEHKERAEQISAWGYTLVDTGQDEGLLVSTGSDSTGRMFGLHEAAEKAGQCQFVSSILLQGEKYKIVEKEMLESASDRMAEWPTVKEVTDIMDHGAIRYVEEMVGRRKYPNPAKFEEVRSDLEELYKKLGEMLNQ